MAWTVSTGPAGESLGSTVEALSRVGQSGRYAEASSGGLGWGSTGEVEDIQGVSGTGVRYVIPGTLLLILRCGTIHKDLEEPQQCRTTKSTMRHWAMEMPPHLA